MILRTLGLLGGVRVFGAIRGHQECRDVRGVLGASRECSTQGLEGV